MFTLGSTERRVVSSKHFAISGIERRQAQLHPFLVRDDSHAPPGRLRACHEPSRMSQSPLPAGAVRQAFFTEPRQGAAWARHTSESEWFDGLALNMRDSLVY